MSLEEIIASYDPAASLDRAFTIPASWYLDPEVAALEARTVFAKSWQVAGRSEQLDKPGQYTTCEVADEPVVLVRGSDSVLRGFYNVCRHHAAAVATESAGEAADLRCPYHGWTYSLEGHLKSAPDLGGICDFDRRSMGLIPVESARWKRWVLVRLDGGRAAMTELPGLDVSSYHWFERRRYQLDCNWKVFVDNYLDGGYHVPHLHQGLNRELAYAEYQIELGDRYCLQWSPYSSGGRALYYWLYPNFMINAYPSAMDTNLVIPRGPNRTEIIFDFFFKEDSEEAHARNAASVETSEGIQNEDVSICESVQRGLASRSYTAGRLSVRREAGEHLFHRLLHDDLKSALR